MSLHIGRLRLRLPAGYETRAGSIARAIAESAGGLKISSAGHIDTLTLGPISVSRDASDQAIAGAVVQRLAEQLKVGP